MSDTTFAPPVDDVNLASGDDRTLFYVVSKRKLIFLFLGTMGLYSIYWFYKNWDQYRDNIPYASEGGAIWPVPRAIFSIFFIHSLFRKIKDSAIDQPQVAQWSTNPHAWAMIVLILVSNALDRLSARGIGSPETDLLSLVILIPLLSTFTKAQALINISCGDADGKANDRLTKANWAWLVFGLIVWVGTIFVLVSSFSSTPSNFASSASW